MRKCAIRNKNHKVQESLVPLVNRGTSNLVRVKSLYEMEGPVLNASFHTLIRSKLRNFLENE